VGKEPAAIAVGSGKGGGRPVTQKYRFGSSQTRGEKKALQVKGKMQSFSQQEGLKKKKVFGVCATKGRRGGWTDWKKCCGREKELRTAPKRGTKKITSQVRPQTRRHLGNHHSRKGKKVTE